MKLLQRVLHVHNRDEKRNPFTVILNNILLRKATGTNTKVHMTVNLVKLFLRNLYLVLEGSYQSYSVMMLGLAGQGQSLVG